MAEEAQGMSKSAKRRAAQKKAKEAEAAAVAEPPPKVEPKAEAKAAAKGKAKAEAKAEAPAPAAEPKAKAKGKAKAEAKAEVKAEPKASAKAEAKAGAKAGAKAKAEPKAEPKPEPKAEPKAKGKAKAKAEAEPKAAPAPKAEAQPEAKAKAKAEGKKKAKAAKPAEAEAPPAPKVDLNPKPEVVMDDGTGGSWEMASSAQKKKEKKKAEPKKDDTTAAPKKEEDKKPAKAQDAAPPRAKGQGKGDTFSQEWRDRIAAEAGAQALAAAKAAAEKVLKEEQAEKGTSTTVCIDVPKEKIGQVIGPGGSKRKIIEKETNCRVNTSGDVLTITGPPEEVPRAKAAVEELVAKGYMSLEYEDFDESFVAVHPSCFPDLIGSGGCVIRAIKDKLDVFIQIPQDVPKNADALKKYKVNLAGSKENVEKTKEIINEIVMYYHHPITHPDQVHEELEVPEHQFRLLIGRAGSEMRHIQNSYKVKVNIPRAHSANKNVVIIGYQDDVVRAKAYCEKKLSEPPPSRERAEQADGDDRDYEDGEELDHMQKKYMVKRG